MIIAFIDIDAQTNPDKKANYSEKVREHEKPRVQLPRLSKKHHMPTQELATKLLKGAFEKI